MYSPNLELFSYIHLAVLQKKTLKLYKILFEDNVNDVRNVFEGFTYEW